MERRPQTYTNHVKFDPWFHFTLIPLLLFLLVSAGRAAWNDGSAFSWWRVGLVVAMLMLSLRCRLYALKVQSRVIRLEERLRMERLLPSELKGRLHELTEDQLVALRFAADEELADATSKALAGKLSNKDIKKEIRHWRPDYFRV